MQSAEEAFQFALANAGASLPVRDTLDERLVNDVINRTGRIIDVQGGFPHGTPFEQTINAWPTLEAGTSPVDTDKDGMPDEWELAEGLNPDLASDRAGIALNGYTNLENYLNGISGQVVGNREKLLPEANIRLFPNPATEHLNIEHPPAGNRSNITLYTTTGSQIRQIRCEPGSRQTAITLDAVPDGIYLTVFHSERGVAAKSFVKE